MSRFAQFYIKYKHEFAPHCWEERQNHLARLFEENDSIDFSFETDEGDKKKTYNHRVYHLNCNPKIVIMRFANDKDIPVERNFEPDFAKHQPSCFVIIDNRDNLRSIAIQKRKEAFGSPSQVAHILEDKITEALYKEYCYSVEILPEYYPEDLYKAWEKLQQHVCAVRFGVPEMGPNEIMQKVQELKTLGKDYFDDTLMAPLLQLAVEAKKAKYKQLYTIMPENKQTALYVDRSTTFVRNLVTLSQALGQPVELVTNDSGSFRCFVEADSENTDKIIHKEFDALILEALFKGRDKDNKVVEESHRVELEGKVLEFVNTMKHESEDEERESA